MSYLGHSLAGGGVLSLCREAVGVFYSPSRLGQRVSGNSVLSAQLDNDEKDRQSISFDKTTCQGEGKSEFKPADLRLEIDLRSYPVWKWGIRSMHTKTGKSPNGSSSQVTPSTLFKRRKGWVYCRAPEASLKGNADRSRHLLKPLRMSLNSCVALHNKTIFESLLA